MISEPVDQPNPDTPAEYPHWNRVYITVLLFTVVVIYGIWLFSSWFTPQQ
jgi:hypothetical protein